MIVVDTSVIVAFMNSGDDDHEVVSGWIEGVEDELLTTPFILAEADHLVRVTGGSTAAAALRADLDAGAYTVEWWDSALKDTAAATTRFATMGIGLADGSLIALAAHLRTVNIATLDERHFRAVTPIDGGHEAFTLLPRDGA